MRAVELVLNAEALRIPLPAGSVDCVITSPPYWGLRSYAGGQMRVWDGDPECAHEWGDEVHGLPQRKRGKMGILRPSRDVAEKRVRGGGAGNFCQRCNAWRGPLGLEPTPDLYVAHLVQIFREVWRVLADHGTLWVNLGDSYAEGGRGGNNNLRSEGWQPTYGHHNHKTPGLKPKDLVGVPWLLAFGLRADGWYLRKDIIWSKTNPMPEPVKDRPTSSHEYVFLLSKSRTYFYDADAVREPFKPSSVQRLSQPTFEEQKGGEKDYWRGDQGRISTGARYRSSRQALEGAREAMAAGQGRNRRSVWEIATRPYDGAHFATFPPELVEPCIKAGSSERGNCPRCGAPWERVLARNHKLRAEDGASSTGYTKEGRAERLARVRQAARAHGGEYVNPYRMIGWRPTCEHYFTHYMKAYPLPRHPRKRVQREVSGDWWERVQRQPGFPDWPTRPAVVLDPFAGSGTTLATARSLRRASVGLDVALDYCALMRRRLELDQAAMWDGPRRAEEDFTGLPMFSTGDNDDV